MSGNFEPLLFMTQKVERHYKPIRCRWFYLF